MNQAIKIYVLFLAGMTYSIGNFAQEVLPITADMFFHQEQLILDDANNWLFKAGNNLAWAAKELDISDWKKVKPTELTNANADEQGGVDAWGRIQLKIAPYPK